ncbi:MAG: hypothetical protein KDN19_19980 [Verrucomicrobiae bacterium]|nr:hypothetical protein [Verrucomicrobiae bacterium]
MNARPFPSLFVLLATFATFAVSSATRAEDPKVFADTNEGVAYARDGERLLLFLLVENFAPESDAILEAINAELAGRGEEFVIVRCRYESADHRKLFEERFKQDPSKMPLGVITNSKGEVVIGTNGKSPEAYRIMIKAARIQGGKEKDPEKVAAIEKEIAEEMEGGDETIADSIFGLKKKDVGPKMLLLSEYRIWTFKNGATLDAALLEAKDTIGVFVKRDGSKNEANFNDLSAGDIAFLTQLLGGGGSQ